MIRKDVFGYSPRRDRLTRGQKLLTLFLATSIPTALIVGIAQQPNSPSTELPPSGQTEQPLKQKIAMSSEIAGLPPEIRRFALEDPAEFANIRERARAVENGTNIYDEMVVRAYLDLEDKHSNTDRVRALARYHLDIETSRNIARMIEALGPTKDPINRLLAKTMRPQDFYGGEIARMTDLTLERSVFVSGPSWGGGMSGDNDFGLPITIFGPYDDRQRVQDEFDLAYRNLVHVGIHERFHTDIQSQSKSRHRIIISSRELYGQHYDDFQDPRSQMSHEAMGLWEYIGGRAIGIDAPEWISWRNYFIADRLMQAGLSPEQTILNLIQISVHGTGAWFETAYNQARLPGDPTFRDLFDKNAVPYRWITLGTETKFLQTLSKLAGLSPGHEFILSPVPAGVPTFTGPEPSGRVAPHIRIDGVKNYAITASIDFTGSPSAKNILTGDVKDILSDINNPKYDYSTLAWLLRADPYWIQGFYKEWDRAGNKANLSYEEFKKILEAGSPKAAAKWKEIEAGPKLNLPKPTGKKLQLTIPPSQWGPTREAVCLAEATWFMPLVTGRGQMTKRADGLYHGEIQIGRVYPDVYGNLIQQCPEGITPYVWLNNVKTPVGYWRSKP